MQDERHRFRDIEKKAITMNRLGVINEKHRLSHQDARAAFDKHGHAQIFLHHPRLVMKQNRFPVPLPAQKNMTIDLTNEDTVMTNEDTVIFDLTKDDEETNDDNQEPIIYQTCLQRVVKLEKAFGLLRGHQQQGPLPPFTVERCLKNGRYKPGTKPSSTFYCPSGG